MRISIATALINGVTRVCLVEGTRIVSSHDTLKQAVDARRVLVLPLQEDRPARKTVFPAHQAHLPSP
jgi:hypothetical protein